MMTAIFLAAAMALPQPDIRDADAVTRLLASLRAADPAVCELAGRTLSNQWGWGSDVDLAAEPMPAPMPTPMPVPMPMPFADKGEGPSGPKVGHHARRTLDAKVLAVFRTALRDQSRCVRRIAARVVSREEPTWAATEFGALTKDADAGLREIGLLGLGELEDPRTIGTMTNALGDRDANVLELSERPRGHRADVRVPIAKAVGHRADRARILELAEAEHPDLAETRVGVLRQRAELGRRPRGLLARHHARGDAADAPALIAQRGAEHREHLRIQLSAVVAADVRF